MRAMPLFAVRAERPGPRVGTVVEACVAARRAVERDVRDGIWPAILGIAGRCRQPPGLKCQKGGVRSPQPHCRAAESQQRPIRLLRCADWAVC
jgi:hypothetical protein